MKMCEIQHEARQPQSVYSNYIEVNFGSGYFWGGLFKGVFVANVLMFLQLKW